MQSAGQTIVRDAALVALASSLLGLAFNAFRAVAVSISQRIIGSKVWK